MSERTMDTAGFDHARGVPPPTVRSGGAAGPPPPRRRAGSMLAAVLLPVLGLAIVLAGWWGYAVAFDVNPVLLPTPPEVLDELIRLRERLFEQARVTLIEIVVGFVATAVIGIVVGTVIAHSRLVDMMVSPWLVALNAAPKVAFAPLLLVWLGHGISPRIAMVILIAFFPVILSTYAGLTSTPSDLVELARSMNSSRWRTFRKLRLPYAVPQIFVGLKVAMPLAAVGAVVGELNGGRTGLGYVIRAASNSGNTALAFAAIVVVSALSILLYYALSATERLVLPWVRATTA